MRVTLLLNVMYAMMDIIVRQHFHALKLLTFAKLIQVQQLAQIVLLVTLNNHLFVNLLDIT